MHTLTETYSSAEACNLAGISYRQLDYWCRVGTMSAHTPARGSGSRRRWSAQQVVVLAVLGHVAGLVNISLLDELAALLLDWDAATWGDTVLLAARGGVWLPDDEGAPPVATCINLGMIRAEVLARATEPDGA